MRNEPAKLKFLAFVMIASAMLAACGKKSKKDGDGGVGDTGPLAPFEFVVNGEVCPSLHCPSGIYSMPAGGSVSIQAKVDTDTLSVVSSDTTGSFDDTTFTDGAFVFTTTVASGETRQIKFHVVNSSGQQSADSGVTIASTPGSLTLTKSADFTGMAKGAASQNVKLVSFGVTPVRTAWTTVSQFLRFQAGPSALVKGVDP